MKIIGGTFKGRNFYRPAAIRPTQNITRKAVFDLLGQDLEGKEFLDLFSGSGAVGLEALSRGARRVVFIEKEAKFHSIIEENLRLLNISAADPHRPFYEALQIDAFAAIKLMARQGKSFDIIFADPPYGRELAKKTLKLLSAYDIVKPNCRVILEHQKRDILPESQGQFLLLGQRKYGSSILSIYNR